MERSQLASSSENDTKSEAPHHSPSTEEEAKPEAQEANSAHIADGFPYIAEITDLILNVQGTLFHVNKGILMIASPVFHKMLTTDAMEKKGSTVHLPEKTVEEISLFLECLYPNRKVVLTDDIVDTVLPLASDYLVEPLRERCETYLEEKYFKKCSPSYPSFNSLLTFIRYGVTCGTKSVQERAIQELAQWESSRIENHESFSSLPGEVQSRIWKARVNVLEGTSSSVFKYFSQYSDGSY